LEASKREFTDLPPLRSAQFALVGPAAGKIVVRLSMLRRGKSTAFVSVKSQQGIRAVQIDYVNRTAQTHVVVVEVNGKAITKIAFPSTANFKGAGRLTIELPLSPSTAGNKVTFRDSNDNGLMLRSVAVLAGSL
jgi:hypothetical protein